ncbi:DUF6377 domain-containing protein [Arcticibacter tournemirensis]|uniref:Tetratricopeptide repeat protein n=1 Tax=Arcticibacter tournemirensis TaxID=699437 RepID=A0A4Q0M9C2_9SPHI|nr:DUF6377 domain-containing protein [Arcticibacter tournemirensis]RXF69777.1 tetratricopeptide repeat protein [Arcticibacter tournemirensis]
MKTVRFLLILLLFSGKITFAEDTRPVITELNKAIRNKEAYSQKKEKRIARLKEVLSGNLSPLEQYNINKRLCGEYQKYKITIAISYADRCLQIARSLKRDDLITASLLQLSNLYSSTGKFLESQNILKSVKRESLSKPLWIRYYESQILFLEHYTTNTYNKAYIAQISKYRDSLLNELNPSSVKFKLNRAQKYIYDGKLKEAQSHLLKLLGEAKRNYADYAMGTYLLATVYHSQGRMDQAIHYYAMSAITDIKNAIKDHASLQNLAIVFYYDGEIDRAYTYTRSAIDDAIFCDVKFRTLRMSELYSIINTAYLEKEAKQKNQLQLYLLLISILSVILTAAIIYVYLQMKKVSRIKEELHITGQQLAGLNQQLSKTNFHLSEVNAQLFESNHVKEVYIAQFFDLCSTYINKLEDYRKNLNKVATEKRIDALFKMLRSNAVVENEIEELYKVFDNIFLNLYPQFIHEFNELLLPNEQVTLKHGELLNTELRIFALVRLGITDSVKIAAFLRYSLSTIYNYRTKARNKARVAREDFEKLVMTIGGTLPPANSGITTTTFFEENQSNKQL